MYSRALTRAFFSSVARPTANKIEEILAKESIVWKKTADPLIPFATKIGNEQLHLRINDFPEEPLYTVMHNDKELFHTNGFYDNWQRHDNLESILHFKP